MAESSQDSSQKKDRLIVFHKLIFGLLLFIWSVVLLPIVVNIISNVITLPKAWITLLKKPFGWAIRILTMRFLSW